MTDAAQTALPAPSKWLFAQTTLGSSFRVYLPTVLLMRGLGLARMLLFAYLILQAEYGLARLALLLINLLSAAARLGVPVGLERYAPQHEQTGQLSGFLRRAMLLAVAVTGGMVLILAAGSPWLAAIAFAGESADQPGQAGYLLQVAWACLAVTLVLTVFLAIQGALRGLRMYRALSLMEVLHGASFLVFGIGGLILAGNLRLVDGQLVKLHGAAVVLVLAYGGSMLLSSAVVGLALAGHLARWTAQHSPIGQRFSATAGRLLRFSTFMTVPNVLWTMFPLLGLWFVNRLHGHAEAGLFALSRDMMAAVQLLAMALWPTAQNSATYLWESGRRGQAVRQLATVFRTSGWLLWLLSAALVLARQPVERLLPADYAGAAAIMPWLLIMFLYMIHLSFPTAHAYLLERTRLLLVAAVLAVTVHGLSADWLILNARAIGAAQSAALGAAAGLLVLLLGVGSLHGRKTAAGPTDQPIETGGYWLGRREACLLLAPILLAMPAVWPTVGTGLLAGVVAIIAALLALSEQLWTAHDRSMLRAYLASSWSAVTGRG